MREASCFPPLCGCLIGRAHAARHALHAVCNTESDAQLFLIQPCTHLATDDLGYLLSGKVRHSCEQSAGLLCDIGQECDGAWQRKQFPVASRVAGALMSAAGPTQFTASHRASLMSFLRGGPSQRRGWELALHAVMEEALVTEQINNALVTPLSQAGPQTLCPPPLCCGPLLGILPCSGTYKPF